MEPAAAPKRDPEPSSDDQRYSIFEPAYVLELQQRERALMELLGDIGLSELSQCRILDVGCGAGAELLRFVLRGANPAYLCGIDIRTDRAEQARRLHPSFDIRIGDAAVLPWPDASIDLVSQFTMFSSVLDVQVRLSCAGEIIRILRPGGYLVWYEFFLSRNPRTRAIKPREFNSLFPTFVGRYKRITLAPPIARRVARRSWLAAAILQELPPLQTHYLAILRKPG